MYGMRWYLNPFALARAAGDVKSVASGGGPKSVRLTGIGNPRGVILPRVPVSLEVVGSDGSKTSFTPELPIGLVAGYGYRIARLLPVPVLKDADPGSIQGEFRIPGR